MSRLVKKNQFLDIQLQFLKKIKEDGIEFLKKLAENSFQKVKKQQSKFL